MNVRRDPQVIVGVDRSMAGLAALRVAIAEAVRRDVPLHAARVRSSTFAPVDDFSQIDAAFQDAFGGFPAGVRVCRELLTPPVALALTERADHPGDLLILGAGSRRGLWRAFWRRLRPGSDLRSCLRRAKCPVIVVCEPEMSRDARTRRKLPRHGDVWVGFENATQSRVG
jgi:nucleotide-binding universal stress UspA family protein